MMIAIPGLLNVRARLIQHFDRSNSAKNIDRCAQSNSTIFDTHGAHLAVTDAIEFWQTQADKASTTVGKQKALERVRRLVEFLETRPSDEDLTIGSQTTETQ